MNTAQLTVLLASFVFGVVFAFYSAWPRHAPLEPPEEAAEPAISWPSMLDAEARLSLVMQLGARPGAQRVAILERARREERDPRILAIVEQALTPVIGEPG